MLGITMRITEARYASGAVEKRDSLAQEWQPFLAAAFPDDVVLPLPNIGAAIGKILRKIRFSGFIFSGGSDWGEYPDRDLTEACIFEYARSNELPVFGVCRGLQVLNIFLGGRLEQIDGHVGKRHDVRLESGPPATVNSWHRWGITPAGLAPMFVACAWSREGYIEAARSADGLLHGVMWHPERSRLARELDKKLMRDCLVRNS